MADSKGENDAGSLGRGDLNLYRNRVCRRKLISNLLPLNAKDECFGVFARSTSTSEDCSSLQKPETQLDGIFGGLGLQPRVAPTDTLLP